MADFMGVFAGFLHVLETEVDIDVGLILSESVVFEVDEVGGLEGGRDHSGSIGRLVVWLLLHPLLIHIGFVELLEQTLGSQVFLVEIAVALIGLSVELTLLGYIEVVQEVVALLKHTKNLIITTILLSSYYHHNPPSTIIKNEIIPSFAGHANLVVMGL